MSYPDITLSGDWANTFVLKHSPNPSWDNGSTYAYYGLWYVPPTNHWNDGTTEGESSHIKVNKTTNEWSDHGGSHPGSNVSRSGETITLRNNGGTVKATFTRPPLSTYSSGSGPSVTSIGASVIFVPNDTVSNTDFTLLKDGAAYSNTNITLTGPGPQLPSDARGYSYSLTYDGTAWYKRTIDSKSYEDFYYDDSWTSDVSGAASNRQTSGNRILNVLGKIPSTTTMSISSTNTWTFDKREDHYVRYSGPTNAGQATPEITFVVSGNSTNIVGWFNYYDETDYINSPTFNIGEQQTMSWTPSFLTNTTFSVEDWVYSNEPEGNGYVPPQQPVRTGGNGYPDRYPLIMTNLFARQRSVYSIGMTHKDTWDLFL
jgi:hypothetical protein